MLIAAYMASCVDREAVREQTLLRLHQTDWGERPWVEIDQSISDNKQQRQVQTVFSLLKRAVQEASEFILILEDDLEFNHHLRHNLQCWLPLRQVRQDAHFFGSLYNPNVRELVRNEGCAFFVADPAAVYGSQAIILSLATARHILDNWNSIAGMQDIKASRLAAQVTPLYYHTPSLIQHSKVASTWGGVWHQACDYNEEWRAQPAIEAAGAGNSFLRQPILARMREIEGWLGDDEAEMLIAAVEHVFRNTERGCAITIVEVGSYCGRATVVLALAVLGAGMKEGRVAAIDPHDGWVTTLQQDRIQMDPTSERFKCNIAAAGLAGIVEMIRLPSTDVHWDRPVDLLYIDALHDYSSVSTDFNHFVRWLRKGGLAAFHDYGPHFPGVQRFVNELLGSQRYTSVLGAGSMIILENKFASDSDQRWI